jgi:hypothetical protein
MSIVDSSPLQSKRRRRRRWLIAGGLIILVAVGAYVALQFQMDAGDRREWQDACAEADALDLGWRYEDLFAKSLQLKDENNSAVQILTVPSLVPQAVALKLQDQKAKNLLRKFGPQDQLPTGWRAALQSEPEAVAAAMRAAHMPDGRMPVAPPPGFASKSFSRALEIQKVVDCVLFPQLVVQVADGDSDGALESARAILFASRPLHSSPIFLDNLVGTTCRYFAAKGIERILAYSEPTPQALDSLLRALQPDAQRSVFLESFRCERAILEEIVRAYDEGRLTRDELELYLGPLSLSTGWRALDKVLTHLRRSDFRHNATVKLRYLTWVIERMRESPDILPLHADELSEKLAALPPNLDIVTWKFVDGERQEEAIFRCAVVAVAAERFRQMNGNWPTALTELVPAFLSAIPPDPFDVKPLRLAKRPDGIVIYSIGANMKDDGGAIAQEMAPKATDLGIRLWDVERRRKQTVNQKQP